MKQFVVFAVIACMAITANAAFSCRKSIREGKQCTLSRWGACTGGWRKQTMVVTDQDGGTSTSSRSRSCRSSGGSSSGSSAAACTDQRSACGAYKKAGYCRYPKVKSVICCKSCGGTPQTKPKPKPKPQPQECTKDKVPATTCTFWIKKYTCTHSYVKPRCCQSCKAPNPKPAPKPVVKPKPKPVTETGSGSSGSTDITGGGDKAALCLEDANKYRRKHSNTNDLVWDAGIARKAQAYAEKLLKDVQGGLRMKHDANRGNVGENLSYKNHYDPGDVGTHCRNANQAWYDEIKDYDWNSGTSKTGAAIGHFTQMVWSGSTKVGYGVAVGKAGGRFKGNTIRIVVARYSPPGNYRGKNLDFVHPFK